MSRHKFDYSIKTRYRAKGESENFVLELYKKMELLAKRIMPWFFKLQVIGAENAKNHKGPLIIAANHKSYADHAIILWALPENHNLFPIRAVAKLSLFEKPILGNFLRQAGAIPKDKVLELIKIIKAGEVVGIYPEGGLRPATGVHKFEKGVAFLARKSGAKILPIAICGLENFTIRKTLFTLNNFFHKRKLIVVFGKTFLAESSSRLEDEASTEQIRAKISELYWKYYNHARH